MRSITGREGMAVRLGESANDDAAPFGRPLDGIRVVSLEQMQALPFATQLLARLGADVVKVEQAGRGDAGRPSTPVVIRENGEGIGATFLRNNLNKRSVAVDLRSDQGRELVLDLCGTADVVCENLGPGKAARLGLDEPAVRGRHPRVVYLSISGFGSDGTSPYEGWPAYASVAEALCGIYEYARLPHQPPVLSPSGGLGDSGTGLFAVIGVLAALRHRDATGDGQHVDVSMLDAMVSLCDISYNYWSLGIRRGPDEPIRIPILLTSFRAADGWFILQVGREHQFERLAALVGRPEWLEDPRLADRTGWSDHLEDVIRPAVEAWAGGRTKFEAASELAGAGLAAAPCSRPEDVVVDPHVARRHMIVEIPRTDGVDQPVLVGGNPIKLSKMVEGPDRNVPLLGEHTAEVLADLLGVEGEAFDALLADGVVQVAAGAAR
jgi:crotonobetainyl-CoA:carnitine CoA-transferase CaiB-like acyl-CoA transferase